MFLDELNQSLRDAEKRLSSVRRPAGSQSLDQIVIESVYTGRFSDVLAAEAEDVTISDNPVHTQISVACTCSSTCNCASASTEYGEPSVPVRIA